MFTLTLFLWLSVAILILIGEILLGTIYLLAVFLGALAASLAAFFDLSLTFQCTSFGVITCAGVFFAWKMRNRFKKAAEGALSDDDLDKGQRITVSTVASDGSAIVQYRGAPWKAYAKEGQLSPGLWLIAKVDGTQLILVKA